MNTPTLPAAGLGRRLAAVFYDALLLFGLLYFATSLIILALNVAVTADAVHPQGPLFQLWLLAVTLAYFLGFWRISGQTPGMRAWRLRLETLDGRPFSLGRGLLRLSAALLSWLCLGAGYWWLWLDPQRRCWHDRFSGSRIVCLAPRSPAWKK